MWKLAMRFLPKEYKIWLDLAQRMFQNLDTAAERHRAVDFFIKAHQSGGQLTPPEWSRFGNLLGVFGKKK